MKELNIKLNIDSVECNFKFSCSKVTTVLDLFRYINNEVIPKMDIDLEVRENINFMVSCNTPNTFAFVTKEQERRILRRRKALLLDTLDYLEIDYENVVIENFGGIGEMFCLSKGIKFYTHSNEENHKYTPHIHTEYKNKEASYSIEPVEKLVGANYPNKVEKHIKEIISSHQDELITFWKDTTNGLYPKFYPFEIDIR